MPLVNMRDMLQHAHRHGYAVGGFELVSLDFIEAIMAAAEARRSPVILSLAESHFDGYDFELGMAATELAAKRASVPVAIQLDHGASFESAARAINRGCNGVMVAASQAALATNVARTRQVVDMARACGVAVEGEPGYVVGAGGEATDKYPGDVMYTSVEEARVYVEQTQVDFLAVSIDTVHGRPQGDPVLAMERLAQLNQALNIPLVLHDASGLSDEQFQQLINNGVAKINYSTALADAARMQMRESVASNERCGYTGMVKGVQQAIRAEVEHGMDAGGSSGRADEVLAASRIWQPVHHVIIFNVANISDTDAREMMRQGESILGKIPGVRRVVTGSAVQAEAKYQFTWLVEFVHEAVIEHYKHHPEHVAFADNIFRPAAADRISIDYAENIFL